MMLLEVASWGIPIVSSDIPENLEILHGCALVFRSGDADHLREQMRWALDHRDAMAALAGDAVARVRRDHGWDHITDKYAELYRSTVRGREATGVGPHAAAARASSGSASSRRSKPSTRGRTAQARRSRLGELPRKLIARRSPRRR
jgi:hypothetical protein